MGARVEIDGATMALPPLYLEGLQQRAVQGRGQLNLYKLGLVEAILKEALRNGADHDPESYRSAMRTALDVVRWEPPRSSRPE